MGSGASSAEFARVTSNELIFFTDYKMGPKLGAGGFAQVRLATEKLSGQAYAVKILDVRQHDPDYAMDCQGIDKALDNCAKQEVELWRQVCSSPHENVVQLSTVYAERLLYYLICEKCKCSLTEMHVNELTELNVLVICRHLFSAIEHIHAKGVMHRDIKPSNLLWGGSSDKTLKLCDFGLAAAFPKSGKKLKQNCGTSPFKAPELLLQTGYDEAVDIWSAGVTAYVLIFGRFPYFPYSAPQGTETQGVEQAIKLDSPPIDFEGTSTMMEEFVRSLLQREPTSRPKASDVLQLPLLSDSREPVWQGSVKVPEALHCAAEVIQSYNKVPDPTIQNSLDELLQKLAGKGGGESILQSTCFSEADGDEPQRDMSIFSNPPPAARDCSWPQGKKMKQEIRRSKVLADNIRTWQDDEP